MNMDVPSSEDDVDGDSLYEDMRRRASMAFHGTHEALPGPRGILLDPDMKAEVLYRVLPSSRASCRGILTLTAAPPPPPRYRVPLVQQENDSVEGCGSLGPAGDDAAAASEARDAFEPMTLNAFNGSYSANSEKVALCIGDTVFLHSTDEGLETILR